MTTIGTIEASREDAEPVDFYKFTIGATIFLLTSASVVKVFNGETYQPTAITRTSPKVSNEESDAAIEVTIPQDHALAQLFYGILPGQRCTVLIRRTHSSIITGTSYEFVFRGYLSNVTYRGDSEAVLRLDQPTTFLNRNGPRFMFTNMCNHILYDTRCQVNADSYKFTGVITVVAEDVVTLPGAISKGADFFDGGYIYYASPAGDDYRVILDHAGDLLRLLVPFKDDMVGKTVTAYAGCKHTASTCQSKFNNFVNFGGFPFVPYKNPFKTRIV